MWIFVMYDYVTTFGTVFMYIIVYCVVKISNAFISIIICERMREYKELHMYWYN